MMNMLSINSYLYAQHPLKPTFVTTSVIHAGRYGVCVCVCEHLPKLGT